MPDRLDTNRPPTPQSGWSLLRQTMGHYVPRRLTASRRARTALRNLKRGSR